MKVTHAGGVLAALLISANVLANEPPVAVNVEGLQPRVAAQVIKHAQQGEPSLARYLERVRPYQRLSYDELSRPVAEAPQSAVAAKREFRRHAKDWAPQRVASAL
jgi:hypothetical protein